MKKIIFAIMIAALLCATVFSVVGHADFGDFGGDSDFGGDWDSGDSWDWDDDDDDYSYGGWSSSGSSSSGSSGSSLGALIALVMIVVGVIFVVVIIRRGMGKGGSGGGRIMPGATPTPLASLRPMRDFLSVDPGFSEGALCEQLSNRYVQFQNAWQAKDLAPLRPYLTDALYAQMDRQLENNYRRTRQTNRVERIAVLGVELTGWRQDAGSDEIVARLRTRIVDYVVSDDTGAVVRGSSTAEKFMEYEWTLTRASGIVTGQTDRMTVHNCPNCGAALNINQTARCEYCGSVITVNAHEWAVSNIKGISQRTSGK